MRCRLLIATLLIALISLGCHGTSANPDYIAGINDGMPFGEIGDSDVDALMAFAKDNGVDLQQELEKAYADDQQALASVFAFSLKFTKLDKNARSYGQVIWSSLLNLGERHGVEKYAEILNAQDAGVQQRIRDILFYPVVHLPQTMSERRLSEQAERKQDPTLFPSSYEFGRNDTVFR
jgi:hypothetical protein